MLRIFLVCMLAMFFAACDDKKIAISDGDNGDTKALDSLVENIDSKMKTS